ncbi:MAG: receptor with intracellular metal dependent phosphohydrolase [Bacteroidetes bacterium]|nr:receptor with intracellular metal dependent phosphohydrolase [Bacteroidota bacterium]
MKKIISFIRHSHPEIYKGILFCIALSVIVYVFPKQGKFKYEFQNLKGKPWYHEDLIAPFDFAIKKTQEELAKEKSEVLKNAKPYLRYDANVPKAKKAAFEAALNASWNKKSSDYLKQRTLEFGKALIDSIYAKGIIQPADALENKPMDYSVFLLNNNIAEEHDLNDFYTAKTAYEYIEDQLYASKITDVDRILPLLENSIAHNIFYDKETTEKVLKQSISDIAPSRDIILKDQSIVSKGEIIDAEKFQVLESLKIEYEEQSNGTGSYLFIVLGQLIIIAICLSVLAAFLKFFRKDIYSDNGKVTFILMLVVLQVVMAHFSINSQSFSIYILPFCILPIIIRAFYDTRVALFVHIVTVLIISFMAPNRFEFAFIQLLGGMVAIFSIVNMRNRSQIFISAVLIFLTYSISYIGITIIQEGNNDVITWFDFAWFGVSALLTLFSYPLIFIFEKLFGFTSDVSLLELSDTNGKLLRELASRAPGTFQHSLQVANLAEEAIYTIGGNSLLVRTGALYHDIGKMEMPMYFIENQASGINPHEDLSYDESAGIIISHVIKGIEIAKKNNLPEQIIDFIRTHHGTTMTAYFYRSFKKAFPEEQIDENKFHYPGPIPFSKETAVLMMADSVEAASRSLKKYDAETIDALVEKIIDSQIEQNQFANADITFRDINTLKKIFKKKLMNMYHVRVEYPR